MKFVYERAKTRAVPATDAGDAQGEGHPEEGPDPARPEVERSVLDLDVAGDEHRDEGEDHEREVDLGHADEHRPVGVEDADRPLDEAELEEHRVHEAAPPAEDDDPRVDPDEGRS